MNLRTYIAGIYLCLLALSCSTFHDAIKKGDTKDVNEYIAKGEDLNKPNKRSTTPLAEAAAAGHTEIIQILLDKGADINAGGNWNFTPLIAASMTNNLEAVKLLVAKGAKLSPAMRGKTALGWAYQQKYPEVIKLLTAEAEGRFLKAIKKTNVNTKDTEGKTALMTASEEGYIKAVKFLLARRAKVNASTKGGMTAFMFASGAGNLAIAKLLHAKGANINAKDNDGVTPLMFAKHYKHPRVVEFLKKVGGK